MKPKTSSDRLTTKEFWVDYWTRTNADEVKDNVFFKSFLKYFPKSPASLLEIGGFPGYIVSYFKKFHNFDVTLLDFIILPEVIAKVEAVNGFNHGDIKTIEGDLFELTPDKKFDVVFSAGFIEHFTNTEDVFRKHVEYLKSGGTLFISLPNFKGIAGLAQKVFDPANYNVHHVPCMEKSVYQKLCEKFNLQIQYLDYFGVPHIWLDHPEKINPVIRKLFYLTSAAIMGLDKITNGRLLHGRYFSPYIVLIAKKN